MSKQYGLIKPGNVFGSSDSEDDSGNATKNNVKKVQVFGQNSLQKRQIEKMHEQAVEQDSSVFLYDEVFDEIQSKRNESKMEKKTQEAKKPKYITKLLETAQKRKNEYERRKERQVQKEREAEGEKFSDKESFVTSAYRQKLEEMKQAELLEKRQEYLENIGDVTKQADLSGFYRHIYSQKMASDEGEIAVKKVTEAVQKKKNYRKRENSIENEEIGTSDKPEHLNSNIDADSDFSVESSSESDELSDKKAKVEDEETQVAPKIEQIEIAPKIESSQVPKEDDTTITVEKIEPIKPKVNIWVKRTVGEVYIAAVKRYYERKALRESN